MAKAAIYARVSTADSKQDYNRQVLELQAICRQHGYKDEDIQVFAETVSGYKKEERLELQTMLNKVEENPKFFNCIYTSEISRIGRDPNQTRKTIDRLTDLGVPIYIQSLAQFTLHDGKRNSIMNIILQVLMEFADSEAETFKIRSKSGLLKSAKEGKAGGGATMPYGYTKGENGMLIIHEKEAEVIKEIYKLYSEGSGTKVIAGHLNNRNIPTKSQNIMKPDRVFKNGLRPVKDFDWSDGVVLSIIRNSLYCGKRNFKEHVLEAPAIISDELFEKCQFLRLNKSHRNYLTTYQYLLKDLLTCGCCGRNYFAKYKPVPNGDKVYICSSRLKKNGNCGNVGVNISLMESVIYNELMSMEGIVQLITKDDSFQSKIENSINELNVQLAIESKLLEKKLLEKNRLLDAWVQGMITNRSEFETRNNTISSELRNIQKKIAVIKINVVEKKTALEKSVEVNATNEMLINAKYNRAELAIIFKKFISNIKIYKTLESNAILKIHLGFDDGLVYGSLKILLDLAGAKRKPMLYRFKVFFDESEDNTFSIDETEKYLQDLEWEYVEDYNKLFVQQNLKESEAFSPL